MNNIKFYFNLNIKWLNYYFQMINSEPLTNPPSFKKIKELIRSLCPSSSLTSSLEWFQICNFLSSVPTAILSSSKITKALTLLFKVSQMMTCPFEEPLIINLFCLAASALTLFVWPLKLLICLLSVKYQFRIWWFL